MKKIGLLSDTHSFLDAAIFDHFSDCDEIWHGGDVGETEIIASLKKFKPLRGVFGNIDTAELQHIFPEQIVFNCEEVRVMMRHIGGYPPRYNAATKQQLILHRPQLFIAGHSHILKIMYDDKLNCLYINPGAAGKQGWHSVRTIVKFVIEKRDIKDCNVIELGPR